jgi:CDP-diacylglycerol--glycerol-3-phosphate 3-phosphatidyltransferase
MSNLANAITVLRILIAPVFLWFLYGYYTPTDSINWILLAAFILVAATDGVDGAVARRTGTISKFGKLLDPIADKVLIGGAVTVLSMLDVFPWWASVAILVREIGMTVYRFVVIKDRVIAASSGGKFKTVLQCITIGWFISPLNVLTYTGALNVGFALVCLTVFITWSTAFEYLRAAK